MVRWHSTFLKWITARSGYEPDFDSLPWQESYNAAKVAHDDSDLEHAYDTPDL